MPSLLSLANELISNIADELDTRKVFRGACRRINAVVSPRVFSYITIDIHRDRLNIGISQLEALATQSTRVAEYVRTIDIRHLTPNYSPYPHGGYKLFNSGRIFSIETEHQELEVEWGQKRMHELLPKALAMLKGTTTVVWMACGPSPDWALVLVSQFLATLPGLDTLYITTPLGKPELHLNRISNLTKLSVKTDHDTTISEIIGNSPYLTHLDIFGDRSEVTDHTPTLHSLLGKVPLGQPLRLEHLSINCYCVRFDHETLPHLRHLRSLELGSIAYIPANERQFHSADLLLKSDTFGSSLRDLWGAVERAGIPLEVVVAQADEGVVDYLALTTGIKKIHFLNAGTNMLANKFFTRVLPLHSKTLASLRIPAPNFEGLWCFGKHNVDILLKCTQLSELAIAVDTTTEAAVDGIVGQIMDMAAQMPNLRWLVLSWAGQEVRREVSHFWNVSRALCKSIASFGPVHPAAHPKLITICGRRKFRPWCGADGVIKYV